MLCEKFECPAASLVNNFGNNNVNILRGIALN